MKLEELKEETSIRKFRHVFSHDYAQARGDQIFVFNQKRYSDKINEIFEEAQREYRVEKRKDTPANRRFRILWRRNRKSASTCKMRCHEDVISHCS